MLKIENVSISYDNTEALKQFSLTVKAGEIIALIGPSGCGKSTLLNALAGNITNYDGKITLDDLTINYKEKSIGLIAQDYGLLPWLKVLDNIALPLKIKKLKVKDYSSKIDHVMEKLKIAHLKNRYPNGLSGGQKQRVSVAKAFIMQLDLLLMDEPFSALDTITREQTQQLFLEVWEESAPITLFVTHSAEEAVFLGTKIIIMSGSPGEIISVIENPAFKQIDGTRFYEMCNEIKSIVKKEWSNG
ncbi:MAG: ABC transporter ATP-binding protein [Defluviitaleaceae bacterium]|nr:ABC transporter ATP-binding protein [Defluviitaleaceae bacterium]